MHTNGGDVWLVIDAMWDKVSQEGLSQVQAREACALFNSAADFFCNKPRFYSIMRDEYKCPTP